MLVTESDMPELSVRHIAPPFPFVHSQLSIEMSAKVREEVNDEAISRNAPFPDVRVRLEMVDEVNMALQEEEEKEMKGDE